MLKKPKDSPQEQTTPLTLRAPVSSKGSGEGAQSAFERLKEIWKARARTRPRPTEWGGLPLPDGATRW